MPLARISLTLSGHPSLSSIAPDRSFMLHFVSVQSCCRSVLSGRPTLARPRGVFHRSSSLMSSSLLLQQCSACLVRLTWMVFEMGGRWSYSRRFMGYCLQDLFNTPRSILVRFLSSFSSRRLVSVHVVHPYSSIDMFAAWKKLSFILSGRSDFHMTDNLSIAVHTFASRIQMSFSVDETLVPM